ncbi:hypothetical protein DRE_00089 [Drechslerella stenobrocha 248]|uniref:Uncharacterized protein n=1 Tax=Drechslerella stenobrocha 248 TaxID=1043628 RepID=W7HZ42_9PEZI|nr:hypothetical protein DRE_00089 [Drechslerella stenobrocha 248]
MDPRHPHRVPRSHLLLISILLFLRASLIDAYAWVMIGGSSTSRSNRGTNENDACHQREWRTTSIGIGTKTILRMGIVNHRGSYPAHALAFYSSRRDCVPSEVVMVARLFDDPYGVQYLDFSSENIPHDIRTWKPIALETADQEGSDVIALLKHMKPGSIYVPKSPLDPARSSYCTGSIAIPSWSGDYDLTSGLEAAAGEYKNAINNLATTFQSVELYPEDVNKFLGINRQELPGRPEPERISENADLSATIPFQSMAECITFPALQGLMIPSASELELSGFLNRDVSRIPEFVSNVGDLRRPYSDQLAAPDSLLIPNLDLQSLLDAQIPVQKTSITPEEAAEVLDIVNRYSRPRGVHRPRIHFDNEFEEEDQRLQPVDQIAVPPAEREEESKHDYREPANRNQQAPVNVNPLQQAQIQAQAVVPQQANLELLDEFPTWLGGEFGDSTVADDPFGPFIEKQLREQRQRDREGQ